MPNEIYEHIGQKLQEIRGQHGMTQEDLAKKINVSPNTVSRWETATYKINIEDLERLSRLFGIPIWSFLPSGIQAPTEQRQALLSATGDLSEDDLKELQRYDEFIRAGKAMREQGNRSKRRRRTGRS